ncbi:MAG: cyclic nucleotide-binding domain-containing protein [Aeromicrobium sp.]|uniref:Crp/Fnr family transcriptional regulator n=1 Tax=Aeromicrobium sp. TaxID=1871063 RepID=UPI003C579922
MSRDQKVDLLSQVSLFARCSTKELKHIASLVDQVAVPAGRALITADSTGQEAFVVVEGEADVTVDGTIINTVGVGTSIGEMSLLDHSLKRSATVTAKSDMQLLVVGPREFDALISKHPDVLRGIAAELARRLHDATHRPLG